MIQSITESECYQVVALLRAMLVEAGLGAWEIEPWVAKAATRLCADHRGGTGRYFITYHDGQPVGMAGGLLRDEHSFLSLKTKRSGRVVDEYVLPAHRSKGLEQRLRTEVVAWILQNHSIVSDSTSPDVARLALCTGGGKL